MECSKVDDVGRNLTVGTRFLILTSIHLDENHFLVEATKPKFKFYIH